MRPASSLSITVLGLTTVIPSMLQLPVITAKYSTATTDAFFLAMIVPTLISAPLFNAASSTLVPAIFHARSSHNQQEEALATSATTILSAATFLGSLLIAIAASAASHLHPPWMQDQPGEMVSTFIWWLIPWVTLQAPVTILQSVALTSNKPWLPSLSALAQQSSITLLLFCLSGVPGSAGLPLSYVIGCTAQFALLALFLPGSSQLLKLSITDSEPLRHLLRASSPVCTGTLAMQAGTVATRLIASGFGVGTITALECATRLNSTLLDITCTGVLTTCFSRWSDLFTRKHMDILRADFLKTIQTAMLYLAPLSVALFTARIPLLTTWLSKLYASNSSLAILSAQLFGVLILALPLEATGRLSVRAYLAGQDTRTPSALGVTRILSSLTFLLLLSPFLSALSLAVAESLASLLTLVCLLGWPTNNIKNTLRPLIKTTALMTAPLLAAWGTGQLVQAASSPRAPILSAIAVLLTTLTMYLASSMLLNPKGVEVVARSSRLLLTR